MICGERGASRNSLFNPKNQFYYTLHTHMQNLKHQSVILFSNWYFFKIITKWIWWICCHQNLKFNGHSALTLYQGLYQGLETMPSIICLVCWHVHIAIYIKLQNKKFHHSIYSKCFINQQRNKKKKSESFFSPANYPPYKTPDQPQG